MDDVAYAERCGKGSWAVVGWSTRYRNLGTAYAHAGTTASLVVQFLTVEFKSIVVHVGLGRLSDGIRSHGHGSIEG